MARPSAVSEELDLGQVWQDLLQAVKANQVSKVEAILDANKSHLAERKSMCCRHLNSVLDPTRLRGRPDSEVESSGRDGCTTTGQIKVSSSHASSSSSSVAEARPEGKNTTRVYSRLLSTAALKLPLHLAAYLGHADALEVLITDGGYDPNENKVENLGISAIHLAAIGGHPHCVTVIMKQGGSVELRDKHGRTPLFLAASCGQAGTTRTLMKFTPDVNAIATGGLDTGRTPLHAAAVGGFADIVHILVDNGAKLNIKDAEGHTPLHLAARDGKPHIARLLVKEGASVNVQDNAGKTPLHTAIPQKGGPTPEQLDIAHFLLRTTKLHIGDKNGATVVHYSSYWDLASLVEDMIKYQTNVNLQDKSGKTPLHYTFTNKNKVCLDTAKVLIANKANIQLSDRSNKMPIHDLMRHDHVNRPEVIEFVRDWMAAHVPEEFGKTLLHLTVVSGSHDIVRFLLQCGVDVDLLDSNGNTPLHLATIGNRTDLIKFLIGKGASINSQNFQQHPPLHYAVMLQRTVAAQILLHHGANIHLKDENGMSALHKASGWGCLDMVKLLMGQGATVNEFQNKGQRPIHIAAEEGKVETLDYLISKGSTVSVQDKDGRTPLHLAAKNGHADAIRALVVNGADVNLVDKDGQSPLHIACFFGKEEAAQALVNRGANVYLKDSKGLKPENVALEMGNYSVVEMLRQHRNSLIQYAHEQLDPGYESSETVNLHVKNDTAKDNGKNRVRFSFRSDSIVRKTQPQGNGEGALHSVGHGNPQDPADGQDKGEKGKCCTIV